jgi:hypothetical protein
MAFISWVKTGTMAFLANTSGKKLFASVSQELIY